MPFVPDKQTSRFTPDAATVSAPVDPAYQELIDADAARARSPSGQRSPLENIGHAAKEMAVGIPELAAQGLTGLAASATNLVNSAGPKELLKNPGESDSDFYARTRNDLTYQPRGELGQAVNSVLEPTIGRAVNAASSGVTKLTGDQAAGELTKDALNILPAAFGAEGASPKAIAARAEASAAKDIPIKGPVGTAADNPVAALRAAGYKMRPSDAAKAAPEANIPGITREKFSGSGDIRKDMIDPNQRLTTKLAATEIGLPANTPRITPKLLDEKRAPHIATYGEVGQAVGKFTASDDLGKALDEVSNQVGLTPEARSKIAADVDLYRSSQWAGPDAVKTISALRRRSTAEAKSQDVNTQDLGHAHRQVADALEDELGRQVATSLQPELAAKFKEARTALAKINDVDSTVKGGQIDTQAMKKLADKGVGLSGNLKIIADAGEYIPHVTRHPQSIADVGAVESPLPLVNPLMDIASGGIRPLIRNYLKSDSFQNRLGLEAPTSGPGSMLGDYFQKPEVSSPETPPTAPDLPPTPSSSMHVANQLAGALGLEPDAVPNQVALPPVPSRFTASVPEATPSNGLPFTLSKPALADQLAGGLSLADDLTGNGGMRFNPPNGPEPGLGARQLLATQENSRPMDSAPTVPPEHMQLADALGLTTLKNVRDQVIPDEFVKPGSTIVRAGSEKMPEGFLAFGPDNEGGLTISRSTLKPEAQGKGTGKAMLLEAANQAADIGKPLHSDTSVTVAQLRVYESLKKAGKLDFEYSDPTKVADALKDGDARAKVTNKGSPVITNIRPVKRSGTR